MNSENLEPREPYSKIMEVDADLAFRWLEGNTHNRSVNQAHVERLAREMQAGRWRLTHQGIAFDTTGLLIDGQHRLWAIVEAKKPIRMRIFFNEPPENRQVLDTGERRSNKDVLKLSGEVGDITLKHLATLRAMLAGRFLTPSRMTPGEEAEVYRRHREAIEFALEHLKSCRFKGVATATVRAVIARAYYSWSRAKLSVFCETLKSGVKYGDDDTAIVLLFQYLIRSSESNKDEQVRRLQYAKTEWALDAYLHGKVPQKLFSLERELFPLPEEMREEAA